MILRSVGIAGAIVVGLAVAAALTLLPAILAIVGAADRPLRGPAGRRRAPSTDGPWARLARRVMRHPVAVLDPDPRASCSCSARRSCTSGSTPRTPRSCRPTVPSRAAFDRLAARVRRGRVRADRRSRSGPTGRRRRPANLAALFDYSRRLAADPRVTRVDSLVDVDPRLTLEQYQLLYGDPNGPRDRYVADGPGGHDPRRPDGVHDLHAVRPEPRRGQALVADLRDPGGAARAAGRRRRSSSVAAPPTSPTSSTGSAPTSRGPPLFIIVTTYLVLFVLLRSVVLPAKALVMNTLSIVASFGALVWIFQDGNLSALARLPAARLRRDHPAGDPVLRPVRAVDGLRGLPAVADEGGLGPDRRQRRGGRARPRAERPDRHLGGAHRGRRRGLVRVRRHRPDQGARASGWRSRSPSTRPSSGRCSCRPRCACSAAGTGGCRPRSSGSSAGRLPAVRGRGRGARSDEPRRLAALAVARRDAPRRRVRGGAPARRSWPTRPRRDRRSPPRPPPPVAVADPLPVVLPRDDGPHDRLTEWWYYTGHLRADDGAPLRLRVRHLPRRARRASRRRGSRTSRSPTRAATASSTPSGWRSAPQVDRSPRGADGEPTGFDLAVAGVDPTRPDDRRPAALDDGRRRRHGPADGRARAGRGGGGRHARRARPRPDARRRPSRRPSTTATAGSTSGRPAARTTTRGPRWTPTGTLTLDGATLRGRRRRLVRPPVGRLHLGRRRRLGLVRGQPRRRHGPHALARPRRRRHATRSSTGRSSTPDGTRPPPRRATPSRSRSPTAGRARRPAPTTRPAGRSRSRARTWRSTLRADGRRPGARHAGDDRRRLLGGLAGRAGDPRRARRSAARPTSS